ncbi:unnamed protein product [Phaedon cochleariae]|uniref:Hexosyltransferase n=1 Tax=Phaedon cochleariae TaxID=80249 RepID=A0A9P0DYY4_PHACE|nr:unnamed protein product [Phaedon cochleariae]
MRKIIRKPIQILFLVIFFILGCIFTSSITPMDRTCRVQDTDREYNIMKNSKFKNPDLIILILSAPENLKKRNIVRDTWLKLAYHEGNENNHFQYKHYFVIGNLGQYARQLHELKLEQSKFKDILILPIDDSYKKLTEKVKQSFQWLSEQSEYGLGFKYVLKCDDDSFVNLGKLISELMHIDRILISNDGSVPKIQDGLQEYISYNIQINDPANISHLNLYWGYFSGNARIQTKGKWKEINWIASDHYLPYALGGGYVLSKNLVVLIGKTCEHLRSFKSEDVSVGMWLAPINNIVRVHDIRFDTEWISRGCKNTNLITHNVSPAEMNKLFKNLMTFGKMCSTETTRRKHYIYDWNVPNSECCKVNKENVIRLPGP